jgi:hypothetical protein
MISAFLDDDDDDEDEEEEDEVRLFSHSSMRLDAVRVSCEAVNLLSAGHGMPLLSVRWRPPSLFRSPKLCFPPPVS